MNPFKTIGPALRRLGVILLIALLVSLFLFLYYFRYVPANRQRTERQGFLSLKQHSNGIQQTVQDINIFFCQKSNSLTGKEYENYEPINLREPFSFTITRLRYDSADIKSKRIGDQRCSSELQISDDGTEIIFLFRRAADKIAYKTDIENLFEKTLMSGAPDFFQSYFIIDNSASPTSPPRIIYHEQALSLFYQLQNDSTVKKFFYSQFPRITDLEISGNQYKAFMQPVNLQGKSLLLIGLKSFSEYSRELQGIPFATLSTIIIAFILVLVILPYIKIFMVGAEEHLGIKDVVFVSMSMLLGTAVIVVILHQLLMQAGAFLRTKQQLYSLSRNIGNSFHNEINTAWHNLKYFDTALAARVDSPAHPYSRSKDQLAIRRSSDDSTIFIKFPSAGDYGNYTIAHWANDTGGQVYKGRVDNHSYQFISIGNREYFNHVRKGNLNSFGNNEANSFWIEPVYSHTTNVFEANISTPSEVKGATMAALSAQLSSVMNTVLPEGYGFYIINNDGLIYFQSQKAVTLQENFLEWANDDKTLSRTLDTRQTRYLPSQYVNNKQFSMLVRPLENLPLHLVVYYCNEQALASLLRVDAFVMFCLGLLYALLFIFCATIWSQTNYRSRLQQSVYQYTWIRHEKTKATFLSSANYFLIANMGFTTIYSFLVRERSTTVFIAFIFPFFTLWGLYILFWHTYLNKKVSERILNFSSVFQRRSRNIVPAVFIGALSMIYYLLEDDVVSKLWALGYEVVSLLALIFVPTIINDMLEQNKIQKIRLNKPAKEICHNLHEGIKHYYMFWLLCICAISIIPVVCFFWYAQNKEIALEVKGRQLDLALKTEQRLSKMDWVKSVSGNHRLDSAKLDSLLFHQGIYTPSRYDIIQTSESTFDSSFARPTELYDTAIKHIGWNYHSLDKFLPFQNTSSDKHWNRDDPTGKCRDMRLAYNLEPALRQPDSISKVKALKIISRRPGVLEYFYIGWQGAFLLTLMGAGLLFVYYSVIKRVLKRLFTINYFQTKNTGTPHGSYPYAYKINWSDWHDEKLVDKKVDGVFTAEKVDKVLTKYGLPTSNRVGSLQKLWHAEYAYDRADENGINELEDTILYNQHHLAFLYEDIWKSLGDKERYFLYDMAKDGFTNYKKTELIQQLLYKGILIYEQEHLRIMSVSFRNFVSVKKGSDEITKLKEKYHVAGTWGNVRTPVLVAITAIGIFLFITQDGLFQRVAALIPTLSSMLGLGTTLLGSKQAGK